MKRLTWSILLGFIFIMVGATFAFAAPNHHDGHQCEQHNGVNFTNDAVQMARGDTCPVCGGPGKIVGRENFAGRIYAKYQCRYGHTWSSEY